MLEYKRISRGFTNYALFPEDIDIDELIKKTDPNKDYYTSIYTYSQEHYDKFINNVKFACKFLHMDYKEDNLLDLLSKVNSRLKILIDINKDKEAAEVKKKISVAGTTDVFTNKLVFDFDSKEIEKSRQDAIVACERLVESGIDESALQVSFSGNKGFSIEVDTTERFTRKQFEKLINEYAGDLETFDDKVKDEQRLFRIPLTKHNVSGLYKIPVTVGELKNFNSTAIKLLADKNLVTKNKDKYYEKMNAWTVCDNLSFEPILAEDDIDKALKDKPIDLPGAVKKTSNIFDATIDLSKKPSWLSSTKYALQEGYFIEGERNTAFMILASTYKNQGFNQDLALGMLLTVAELQAARTGENAYSSEQIERNIINYVYSDNWKGGTYAEKETDLLKTTTERFGFIEETGNKERQLYSVTQSLQRFNDYAKDYSKNRVRLGLKQLDDNLVLTTGMCCGILGSPGAGKTSLANYFMKYTSQNEERVLFESLDMSENFIMARFLQNYVSMTFDEIMHMLEHNDLSEDLVKSIDQVAIDYKNVSVNYKSGTDVADIENDIKKHNEMYGTFPRLVVVDYLEKIRGPYPDANANVSYVISRLTDLAKEYNTCILILLQPQKNAGDPRYPLLSMRKVKGSSVIEQDCRVILTLWRPGFNPKTMDDDKYMSIAIVKNNMGGLGQYDFAWDGLSGDLRDLSEQEQFELQELNDRLVAERADFDDGNYNGY